jgi:SAM-dependent methyltransferase
MGVEEEFKQAYGPAFARAYNDHFTFFADRVAPRIIQFFQRCDLVKNAPKTVLDVCCGTGQLASRFLEAGYAVTGIDLSPHMLELARVNNAKAVVEGVARFRLEDAASFSLDSQVTYAVSSFDSLNHLPTAEALGDCFRCVHKTLDTPGVFVYDLNTPSGLERWNGINIQDREEITLIDRGVYSGGRRAIKSITGFVRKDDGAYERFSVKAYNTVFSSEEVLSLLSKAGFTDSYAAREGDLETAVSDPDALPRAFFVTFRC